MDINSIYNSMQKALKGIVPEIELKYKAELVYKINNLKKEKNAIILGHNYMEPALFYTIPDIKGDSLELSRKAAEVDNDIIVFCGVKFMAETAKIINPDKTVLIPSEKAGCSLAESITAADVRRLKKLYPTVPVVTYVNTYADVKAESYICCTSSNAVSVVNSLNTETVIFLPDEFLSKNVARETGKHIIFPQILPDTEPEKNDGNILDYQMIGWKGRCEVHEKFSVEDIDNVRKQFSNVVVLAHPECSPEVVEASDFSGSTTAMIKYVEKLKDGKILLLTECSMGDNIITASPDKDILRLCSVRCPHMNQITLEDTLYALTHLKYKIEIPEDIRLRAFKAVQRMIEIS